MRAMILEAPGQRLKEIDLPVPEPASNQVLIKVKACGVCRTDLHVIDGELTNPKLPLILGHEIVGTVVKLGKNVKKFRLGDRLGVPWLGATCKHCHYCQNNKENLCDRAQFTGYNLDGGYAEYTIADRDFCFPITGDYSDASVAPLLCAGLIGYRSYKMTENARKIGFYGFGAAAHILIQIARDRGREIYAFTRAGDEKGQQFARQLGAVWAGSSEESPPEVLDAAIIFAPVGKLVPVALQNVDKGGIVVCAGIHMSDIPSFPYHILWSERILRSVANLTRQDGEEFLALAGKLKIQTQVQTFALQDANAAIDALRAGKINGAAVLTMD